MRISMQNIQEIDIGCCLTTPLESLDALDAEGKHFMIARARNIPLPTESQVSNVNVKYAEYGIHCV